MREIQNIIKRPEYVIRVKPYMNKSLIKVFTGQRRVGKSYILFQLMQELKDKNNDAHIVYINCEDIEFGFIKTTKELNDYVIYDKILQHFSNLSILLYRAN